MSINRPVDEVRVPTADELWRCGQQRTLDDCNSSTIWRSAWQRA